MTDHLTRIFPNYINEIMEIIVDNDDFAELCADFEEMCTWMAIRCREIDQPSKECEQALQTLKELEEEILTFLVDQSN